MAGVAVARLGSVASRCPLGWRRLVTGYPAPEDPTLALARGCSAHFLLLPVLVACLVRCWPFRIQCMGRASRWKLVSGWCRSLDVATPNPSQTCRSEAFSAQQIGEAARYRQLAPFVEGYDNCSVIDT